MTFWFITYFSFFMGLLELKPLAKILKAHWFQSHQITELRRAIQHLKLLQEMLESGLVPENELWKKIESFPAPWGKCLSQSLMELRSQGAAVWPTLLRMQKTLEEQTELIYEGKNKSAQAFGQALLGLLLVPLFGGILYFMLPELHSKPTEFFLLISFSMVLSSVAWVWMMWMVDRARYGNLSKERRNWIWSVNVALERLLALISTGSPPDLAWRKMIEELVPWDPILVGEWKSQVWDPEYASGIQTSNESEKLVLQLGTELRRSIQTSLIEGRACMDRIESLHRTFLLDLRMKIGRELALLPNRTLKPLFILVLPSVMILLIGSLLLSLQGFLPS